MSFGKRYEGMGTFDEVVNGKPQVKPGHLRCFTCRAEFDPSRSAIKGRRVAPSMNCNRCLNAGYEQGRWQEVFLYDAAGGTDS